jgi:hypothetical protein
MRNDKTSSQKSSERLTQSGGILSFMEKNKGRKEDLTEVLIKAGPITKEEQSLYVLSLSLSHHFSTSPSSSMKGEPPLSSLPFLLFLSSQR